MLTRRDFLARFLATAAGAAVAHTLDVDKLLWTPGARTIVVPPPPVLATDREIGISIRFIRNYDLTWSKPVERLDVFYGVGALEGPYGLEWAADIKRAAQIMADRIDANIVARVCERLNEC